jgi:hypothetical protein
MKRIFLLAGFLIWFHVSYGQIMIGKGSVALPVAGGAPTFVGAGTLDYSGGNTAPTIHASTAVDDLMILAIETSNSNVTAGTNFSASWTEMANSPVALASFTKLHVFYKLYEVSDGSSLTINDPGDHNGAQIFTFRNVDMTTVPTHDNFGTYATTTSLSISGGTTVDNNTMVVFFNAGDVDGSTTSRYNGIGTNATLTDFTQIGTGAGLNGNGGSLDAWAGTLATAGSAGTLTGTIASTGSAGAWMAIGLKGTGGAPADTTPPTFSSSSITGIGSTAFNLSTTTDETATTYFVVVADAATAPSVAQVKLGNNASDVAALASGSSTGITLVQTITGMTASTAYDVYFVARDVAGNDQAAVTKLDVTTISGVTASTLTSIVINSKNDVAVGTNPDGYVEYLPENFDPSGATKYPILYWLHGIGSAEIGTGSLSDVNKLKNRTVCLWLQSNDVPFIVITPQDHNGYWGTRFQTFVEWVNEEYAAVIDVKQQHGAGLSGGGWGIRNFFRDDTPESRAFATFTPMSTSWATINSSIYWNMVIDDDQHMWWHHGDSDTTIPSATNFHDNVYGIDSTRTIYTLYIGMGHSAWNETYDASGIGKSQTTGGNYYEWTTGTWWQWMLDNAKP